jgi:hypothetical protein
MIEQTIRSLVTNDIETGIPFQMPSELSDKK